MAFDPSFQAGIPWQANKCLLGLCRVFPKTGKTILGSARAGRIQAGHASRLNVRFIGRRSGASGSSSKCLGCRNHRARHHHRRTDRRPRNGRGLHDRRSRHHGHLHRRGLLRGRTPRSGPWRFPEPSNDNHHFSQHGTLHFKVFARLAGFALEPGPPNASGSAPVSSGEIQLRLTKMW
jgi:hypothetical protein